ncbi:MAG: hypothetical protein Q7S40_07655 [Opitutaceae bacterium]|nr:hypothetical protein [Opitutaceae bacterium]
MNHPDPELDDPADDMPALPAGEMPAPDELPLAEPSGPPAATSSPFGELPIIAPPRTEEQSPPRTDVRPVDATIRH